MKKLNIKRAFKTLVKNGDGRIYVQKLENNYSTRYLVANAHAIITVNESDFEANKEFLQNVTEYDLTNIIRKGIENSHKVKLTTVSIYCSNVLARVIKGVGTRRFCVVNEEYISMLRDAGCEMDNFVVNSGTTCRINSTLTDATIINGEIEWAYVVLPIICDVVNVLEDVLE